MKSFIITLSLIFVTGLAFSQHNHYVYLQTDNKQPFYIKLNEKLYSSSAGGYAIVPKLQKGEYVFVIGFPKNEWPQQTIKISVASDAGYMLKNFGEKGWGLYNIQTMDVVMAGNATSGSTVTTNPNVKSDGFSNTLANVVNTPSINTVDTDSVSTVKNAPATVITDVPKTVATPAPQAITKLSASTDRWGNAAMYVVKNEGTIDTVNIFIPAEKVAEQTTIKMVDTPISVAVTPKVEAKNPVQKDKKFLDIELPNPNNIIDTTKKEELIADTQPVVSPVANTKAVNTPDVKPLTFNSDCKALATEDDFFKIRKKMAAENNEDDMVDAAKKMFKLKCYSTEQVKNLSLLFLKDAGKYNFFDAAYAHIHDTQNFGKLQAQLSDEYYINRFKAMIRN